MISFQPTEEQELVRDAMHEFAEKSLRPCARECDEAESVPDDLLQEAWGLGLTATQLPEEFGGGGEVRSPLTNTLLLEELSWGDAALALAAVSPSLFAFPVADQGTPEQKSRYLPAFGGERFHAASLALVEPSPVFDPTRMRTLAEPKGDRFVLSGAKCFVPMGDRASHFLVLARNGSSAEEGFGALDAFVVPRDAHGLSISLPERNLGLKALPTAALEFDRVEVPVADRLGGDEGIDARRLVNHSRTAMAAVMVGLGRAVMDYAIPYAKDRVAFDQAIAQKQAVAFMLSDMAIETDACRWLVWKAASQLEQGLDATRSTHLARSYTAEQCMKIADNGVQVLGGHGFIREHPVEMWYRNARTLGVLDGLAGI
ncbi:MAG: acyl-CoA dehydrogenase family protein [Myxococcota bacterium]